MVRAILEGRKTQTRRKVKHDIPPHLNHVCRLTNTKGEEGAVITEHPDMRAGQLAASVWCPYGNPGDRLWVRETFHTSLIGDAGTAITYKSGPETTNEEPWHNFTSSVEAYEWTAQKYKKHWMPSIHMPRWASRIDLEVTGVRVERLNDCSRGDAMAEGCPFPNMADGPDPRKWYAELWEQINGPGSWDANPWVWVVGFKVIKP